MELFTGLAKEGLGWTLFVIAGIVNIYQYKLNQSLQNKRVEDWQTGLSTANTLASVNQKAQESAAIMQQGVDVKLQRILDKLSLK